MELIYKDGLKLLEKHVPKLIPKLAYCPNKNVKTSSIKESIVLEDVPLLYVYGLNQGELFHHCIDWLKDHKLVILEDDIDQINSALYRVEMLQLLSHPNVYFRFITTSELHDLAWEFIGEKYQIYCSKLYEQTKKELFSSLSMDIQWLAIWVEYQAWGDLEKNHVFFENFFNNIKEWKGVKDISTLKGAFKDIPAIICGAGPSIENELSLLKCVKNKGLIFAGGSAINVLTSSGIIPHVTLGLDPTEEECERFRGNGGFEIPFFYRMRLRHTALKLVHGLKGYVSGKGWYPIEKDFDKQFCDTILDLDEGVSVTCFGVELAAQLGCSPIILLGGDLSYTEERRYARGVQREREIEKDDIKHWFGSLKTKDRSGKIVTSQWKWIIESKFLATCPLKYSNHFINASSNSLPIENFETVPLKNITLTKEYDLNGVLHALLQTTPDVKQGVETFLKDFKSSLMRCEGYISTLLDELYFSLNKGERDYKKRGKVILTEMELEEESAFIGVLDSLKEMMDRIKGKGEFLKKQAEELIYFQKEIDLLLSYFDCNH
jgi:hypothetical protein